jgi:hypothetical protein
MTSLELEQRIAHLAELARVFTEREVLGPGCGYHYTQHYDTIRGTGQFFGAPVNGCLGATQPGLVSRPATDPDGVIFAYQTVDGLRTAPDPPLGWESPDMPACHVIRLYFKSAVRAWHAGDRGVEGEKQLLVPVSEIMRAEGLGRAREVRTNLRDGGETEEIHLHKVQP